MSTTRTRPDDDDRDARDEGGAPDAPNSRDEGDSPGASAARDAPDAPAAPSPFLLPYHGPGAGAALTTGWRMLAVDAAPEQWDPALDDDQWPAVTLPHLGAATHRRPVVWYRLRMTGNQLRDSVASVAPPSGAGDNHRHIVVKFGGAFYRCRVWWNGVFLGEHRGYFAPFGFDVTDLIRDANVMAVRCDIPLAAGDFRNKRAVTGIFSDWDCKPYPSAAYPNLPPDYEWREPAGLWRPVTLHAAPPVVAEALTVWGDLQSDDADTRPAGHDDAADRAHESSGTAPAQAGDTARPAGHDDASNPAYGSARAQVILRNLARERVATHVALTVRPWSFNDGAATATARLTVTLAPSEQRTVDLAVRVAHPRLWWPWTHGSSPLYDAEVTIATDAAETAIGSAIARIVPSIKEQSTHPRMARRIPADAAVVATASEPEGPATGRDAAPAAPQYTTRFGFRHIEALVHDGSWEWRVNGRRIFPRGSNYIADLHPDQITTEGLRADVALARGANLDMLRAHAHIAPDEFYTECDAQGVMVMCDFPLQWTYAHDLSPREREAFEADATQQAEQMARLLGSHPSIALWSMHNEPPWTRAGDFLGQGVHKQRTNESLDQALAERVRRVDALRPTQAASGDHDEHLYHGWYRGSWEDNRALTPAFPSEFGVQALPDIDSPVWGLIASDWPVRADDPSWIHAGYQALFWAHPGVGPPESYATLADYALASQGYQAFYIRTVIDQWRRRKFAPVGGYIHFLLTDGAPLISWSVLDYFRLPKAGYRALAEASSPVAVCLDLLAGYRVEGACTIVYDRGGVLTADAYIVNDDYRQTGSARLEWWVEPDAAGVRAALGRLGARARRRRQRLQLPHAAQGALHAAAIQVPLKRAGEFSLRLRLMKGRHLLNERALEFRVGRRQTVARHARRAPGFLVRRVYQRGSLRHAGDGFAFRITNPAMPVTIERVSNLTANGRPIDRAHITLIEGGVARRATTITPHAPLELPAAAHLAVLIADHRLAPGAHQIEITVTLATFGEITARITDTMR